ncbi:MAG: ERF family protein [Terriglobales bacterium]
MSEAQSIVVPEARRAREVSRVVAPAEVTNPIQLLAMAVAQGADLDKLERLMALKKSWEADEARKAFTVAMSEFKQTAPKIVKDAHVRYANKAGSITEYDHATLGAVCQAVIKGLSDHGVSHRWITEQPERMTVKVTCVLTHAHGHSESATLVSAPDDSGGKNSIQAIASAVSYLQRYTLLSVTGLATNMDDDARTATGDKAYITEDQVKTLIALGTEVGADKEKFLRTIKVARLEEIPAASYPMIVGLLEAKRSIQKRAAP